MGLFCFYLFDHHTTKKKRKMVFGTTLEVESPHVSYTPETITSEYSYHRAQTRIENDKILLHPLQVLILLKQKEKFQNLVLCLSVFVVIMVLLLLVELLQIVKVFLGKQKKVQKHQIIMVLLLNLQL